ncbi:2-dehydro-3-deoxygalactonokinase (plasmid) [Paroceanicella profunda]|uniref:2-dehydro-3-deoxygalactonokinase n=1 Tax=Paroceanicella profunda TaxID=2579971 RepID=A0A5B8G3C6_9RHOB|nr:2-dehydro-3-deoxygalactonokinase [Paroceanicella profunda]QDL93792.1 2-dehydro-3-deoxygalactonokinase [Paroceanicella profunda]QDL94255.1 2-dehydro-3-deoxygalactonokinase [Paroceanicella profunda]
MSGAFCAAVDWGTSSFRLWLLDASGAPLAERRSDQGMSGLTGGGFGTVLESHLAALSAPADLPVVVCGMAGARQGWIEAPYVDTPAALDRVADHCVRPEHAAREVRILPGVAQRDPAAPDVMRGEETQLLGAFAGQDGAGLACMPGTHSKWVRLSGTRIDGFSTVMTGEMFAALGHHTILSHSLAEPEGEAAAAAFAAAVRRALARPEALVSEFFRIRAGGLLGFAAPGTGGGTLSGLLIGAEIAAARALAGLPEEVTLIASGAIAERYGTALALAGCTTRRIDADGAARAGLFAAATRLWPTRNRRD